MKQEFIDLIKKLVVEQGTRSFLDPEKCKVLLSDYGAGNYKSEARLLNVALEADCAKLIAGADNVASCKTALIRSLEDEHFIAPGPAGEIIDLLCLVLRGEVPRGEIPRADGQPDMAAMWGLFNRGEKEQAAKLCEELANAGNAEAQFELGRCYLSGIGVPLDESKALEWLRKASAQGQKEAMGLIAKLTIPRLPPNPTKLSNAPLPLPTMDEITELRDRGEKEQAAKLCEELANAGNAEAQYIMGEYYFIGDGVPQDSGKAVEWYRKSAEQGNADAQGRLGLCCEYGRGVSKDHAQAEKWYRKAAAQGHEGAQLSLELLASASPGMNAAMPEKQLSLSEAITLMNNGDAARAIPVFQQLANAGDAIAQCNLGWCYANGKGVPQDYGKAEEWYCKAAEQGNVYAQSNLGACYETGKGVLQDNAKAVEWYRKAAEQGNAIAQNSMGLCYANGRGVPHDAVKAAEWYRKAAEQGNEEAIKALEENFEGVEEQEKDEEEISYGVLEDYLRAGKDAMDNNDPKKAIDIFTFAIENGYYLKPVLYERRGDAYFESGEFQNAAFNFSKASEYYADDGEDEANAHVLGRLIQAGNKMLDEGEYENAVYRFKDIVEANPDDAVLHNTLGIAYYKQMSNKAQFDNLFSWTDALEQFCEAARLNPGESTYQNNVTIIKDYIIKKAGSLDMVADDLVEYAEDKLEHEDIDGAIDAYSRALVIMPNWDEALAGRAAAYLKKGD
jgi:TPR repeat protein